MEPMAGGSGSKYANRCAILSSINLFIPNICLVEHNLKINNLLIIDASKLNY